MKDFHLNRRHRFVLTILLVLVIGPLVGCAGLKGATKKEEAAMLPDQERKQQALKLFKEGADLLFEDDQEALFRFDQARMLDPELMAAHYNAGVAEEMLGNLAEAGLRYQDCLSQDDKQASCLGNLLLVQAKLSQKEEAQQLLERYLNEYKEEPFVLVAASELALFNKDHASAERYARAAIERDAENVQALYLMARIFFEKKQWAAAKWVAKNALELAPSHGGLHLVLGHTEYALGLLHDALDSYALAVKYQPTPEALESYGLLLLKRGRVDQALPVLERLVKASPNDYRSYLHLGNAHMANKMFDEAKSDYLKAQELKSDDLDIDLNLGLLYFELKPPDITELERMKIAQAYFKSYLKKTGLKKDQKAEVERYLKTLAQGIEFEEYQAQAAREAKEEQEEAQEPLESEGVTGASQPSIDIEKQPPEGDEILEEQDGLFDEEEEEIFEEL